MEVSRFFNSTIDDVREYNSSDFASYFDKGYSSGVYRVNGQVSLRCTNTGLDMNTSISLGSAMIKGYNYEIIDSPLVLTHDVAHATYNRIDRVVLRLDLNDSARNIKAFILKGTPNENPVPPTLTRNSLVFEISLCQVGVNANSSTIPTTNIIDERMDKRVCGIVSSQLDSEYVNLEDYTMEITAFDANNQPIEVSYYNSLGLLHERSRLEDIDENSKYTTLFVFRYLEDGSTIGQTKKWKLTYNADGFITRKELVVM